jgi:NarL family two-component system sensor histidine kinase LiaS
LPDRLDLARRLHDGPAQQIVALGLSLDEVISSPILNDETRHHLRKIRLDLFSLSQSLRDEIYLLRSKTFIELETLLREILGDIRINIELPNLKLNQDKEDGIVRSIGEIARNSARHSGCDKFNLSSQVTGNNLIIEVSDNGVGGISHSERNFGIHSITEAIEIIGGTVTWESDGAGSRYRLIIGLE